MRRLCLVLLVACATCALADEPSNRLFSQATGMQPAYSLRVGDRIAGIVAEKSPARGDICRVVALRAAGGSWKQDAEKRVGDGDTYLELLDTFSRVDVGDRPYLLFDLYETFMGTALAGAASVRFVLVDVQTLDVFTLVYAGEARGGGKVKGAFEEDPEIARRPELLKVLKETAAGCARILQPAEKDPLAWEARWREMNASLPDVFRRRSFAPRRIRWEYYARNPLAQAPAGAIVGEKEDARYRILSYFRNSVIGYDKSSKRYFPIWAEHCNHGCNKEIRALDNDVLELVYNETEGKVLYVDLKRKTAELREE